MRFAHGPDTIRLGDLEVRRLGFGAMRLSGRDPASEPDAATAHAVLRRAIELGVNLVDTAAYYGAHTAHLRIVEALHPYPTDLVIATKVGARREANGLAPALRPDEIFATVDTDLKMLRLEQLPLVHLRWSDQSDATFVEALDALIETKRAGKVRHIGLSNIDVAQLDEACAKTPIACVQNLFNLRGGGDAGGRARLTSERPEAILAVCEQRNIAFLPFFPLAVGALAVGGGALDAAAKRHQCTPAQLALAWLLARSPVMLPIPGTSKVAHVEENLGAVRVALDPKTIAELAPNA